MYVFSDICTTKWFYISVITLLLLTIIIIVHVMLKCVICFNMSILSLTSSIVKVLLSSDQTSEAEHANSWSSDAHYHININNS